MKVGLTIFPTDYSIQPPDLAIEAEERDFESIWLPEHSHIPTSRKSPWPGGGVLPKYYYESYDPFVSLGAAAAVTKRIKLATGICLIVERDPIHTAKEVSTVDRLSSGRFIFGVGGGWNAEEMANHGTAFETRFKLMRERILAMKEIWGTAQNEIRGRVRQVRRDHAVAEAGAEAASTHHRWWRLCTRRQAGNRLRRWLDADRRSCRSARSAAGVPQAGARRWPRSVVAFGQYILCTEGSGSLEEIS
jgi:alkanesulfonate monooxygenase SsuD/methylene tetrahydromethanopterin reductase-like flavin-dependent oxidoreductase (luciferase family)